MKTAPVSPSGRNCLKESLSCGAHWDFTRATQSVFPNTNHKTNLMHVLTHQDLLPLTAIFLPVMIPSCSGINFSLLSPEPDFSRITTEQAGNTKPFLLGLCLSVLPGNIWQSTLKTTLFFFKFSFPCVFMTLLNESTKNNLLSNYVH